MGICVSYYGQSATKEWDTVRMTPKYLETGYHES